MTYSPLEFSSARILVTNDDGINAPGLAVLIRVARSLSSDVWVVAPETNQTGAAHSLSLAKPLRAREVGQNTWAIDGTPTDCVLFAARHVLKKEPPTLLLSGVNRGANLADDVTYSGTIAAAMEGCLLGVRSIALSQAYKHPDPVKWGTAEKHAADVIKRCLAVDWSRTALININFPDVPADAVTGVEVVKQGQREFGGRLIERLDPRGTPYYWIDVTPTARDMEAGTDIEALGRGAVTINPLHLDLTHETMRRRLHEALGQPAAVRAVG